VHKTLIAKINPESGQWKSREKWGRILFRIFLFEAEKVNLVQLVIFTLKLLSELNLKFKIKNKIFKSAYTKFNIIHLKYFRNELPKIQKVFMLN